MAGVVGRLRAPGADREELVADVEERHRVADPAAELELEDPAVEAERLVEVVADLERDVVDADELRPFAHAAKANGDVPCDAKGLA